MADAEQNLDLSINVDIGGVKEKIDAVTSKIKEFVSDVGGSAKEATEKVNPLSGALEENKEAADEASRSFQKMTGAGLALLFAGRFLDQAFGGLARSMFDMFGITDMFSGAMKTVLLPAFQLVTPIIIDLINKFMNMNDTFKMVVGFVVLIAAALAPVIALVGQLVAGLAAFGVGAGAVATAIGVVIGALAILVVGFKTGIVIGNMLIALFNRIKEQFSLLAGAIVSIVQGDFSSAFDKLVQFIQNIIDWTINDLKTAFQNVFGFIPDIITDAAANVLDAALDLGANIIDGIVQGIKSSKDLIIDALNLATPGLPIEKIMNVAGGALDSITSANDFVLSDGKLVRTHPNDTIMATKDPGSLGQGGDSGGDTVIVKDPTVRDDRDVDKIADEVEKRLDRQTRGRSGIR